MPDLVKISEAASLGIHTMALLADSGQRRMTNQRVAGILGGSVHHLAKVMQRLVKAKLVDSVVGPQGGFRLAKPAGRINLLTIYEAIEGPVEQSGCLLAKEICEGDDCLLGNMVRRLNEEVCDHLKATTLAELAESSALVRTLHEIQ